MFSETKYYAEFKKVRNQFRKYRYHDLIGGALEYINIPVKDKIESLRRGPWMVLLFVKWILLDDNFPNRSGKIPTKQEVLSLLQSSYELNEFLRMPNEYDHHALFFAI